MAGKKDIVEPEFEADTKDEKKDTKDEKKDTKDEEIAKLKAEIKELKEQLAAVLIHMFFYKNL
jgi:molecular chaperone GrpE (heat shock protein)